MILGGRWKALTDKQHASYEAKTAAERKHYSIVVTHE